MTADDVIWRPHPNSPQERFLASSCFEVLYGGQAGGGKRLRIDEPIATPSGWTTMGALRPGDVVFDADGRPCAVTFCSPVELAAEAWELAFSDGTTIECDGDHLWVTLTDAERDRIVRASDGWRAARRAGRPRRVSGRKSEVFTVAIAERNAARGRVIAPVPDVRGSVRATREIVSTLIVKGHRTNHSVENAAPLDLPAVELAVDPYVLGVWFGDGHSRSGHISGKDEEVFTEIAKAGFEVHPLSTPITRSVHGLSPLLRRLGLLRNKHVPQAYLRASIEQRVALLQGLCDTDGHATEKGSVEFTTTSAPLRDGMLELLASLGIKPSCREGRAKLWGRDISPKWRIQFWTELPAFRIPRKLARQKRDGFRGCHGRRYIVSARRVAPSPMRCIAVDSPTRTYLAGRAMIPTHNTDAMVMAPLRWCHEPTFRAAIFRRTWPELKRSVLERAWKYYPRLGAHPRDGGREWVWPSGAAILLASMERAEDRFNYSSAEFQFLGFEELSTFEEVQYTFMISRMRSSAGIPQRLRANTNPPPEDSPGAEWIPKRFGPWVYRSGHPETPPDFAGPFAAPGEVLHVIVDEETGESLYVPRGTEHALGRTFIPASLYDNPSVNPAEYEAKLRAAGTDPVTMLKLLKGDWFAGRRGKGSYFRLDWFHFGGKCHCGDVHPQKPERVRMRARIWDRAATEEQPGTDPDFTAGVLMSIDYEHKIWVEDVRHFRLGPGEVEKTIIAQAPLDGSDVTIALLHDPGQAGKYEMASYVRQLGGYHVVPIPVPRAGKLTIGKPWSGAVSNRRVFLVRAPWNAAFVKEHELVPNGKHDDQFDAAASGYRLLHGTHPSSSAGEATASGAEQKRAQGVPSMHRARGGF